MKKRKHIKDYYNISNPKLNFKKVVRRVIYRLYKLRGRRLAWLGCGPGEL